MTTTLRILKGEHSGYHDLGEITAIPVKGDHVVFKEQQFTVLYREFDYDTSVVYVVVK